MAKTVTLAILSILLVVAIILQPDAAFQASLQGLTVWWNIVFPGLLPFLVLFEMITAFGLAHAIGAILQPLMKRLFKLPGESALAIVLGWMGGYPTGAEAVASLRKRNLVTKQQGQRLLALTHMPNPLFMLVVIGAGFLHKPIAGSIIAAAVWLSALWLILLTTLWSRNETGQSPAADKPGGSLLGRAADALRLGREQDGRSFGKALGDAVSASFQKLMMIGGFMIFAAVLAKLSEPLFDPLLRDFGLGFITQAFFESHLGAYAAAIWDAPGTGTLVNAAAIAAVLAWSGLSGILQAGYAISGTDLKLLPFVLLRTVHAAHAALFMLLLWKPATSLLRIVLEPGPGAMPATAPADSFVPNSAVGVKTADLPSLWPYSITGSLLIAVIGITLALMLLPYRRAGKSH
ncbi:nucleoside recognition domain-containing protein [Paenibacillus alkaliterrae]|uniref:nucleoside recognition domain-containing protein n=1 Tax=Paenibacillus alkaliterrae TaxID=320909 RepID=UPI001F273B56|nr:nucleoside recognition domain-containing protein [Paenibacillus alkaliterrae]MCF2936963.1 nucleoside recognition domain-containing protein [Paenibacillus alkaliterrae]